MKILPVISALFTLVALSPWARAAQPETATARLSVLTGPVDLRTSSKAAPKPVANNALLAARNIITTHARARSEFRIGNTLVRLDAESGLEIKQLDAKQIILNLHYGSVFVQSASAALELHSAQGRVSLQPGAQLRMDAVTQPDATALRLFSGNAHFTANGAVRHELQAGMQLSLRAQGNSIAGINRDEFDDWALGDQADTPDVLGSIVNQPVSHEPMRRLETVHETTTVISERPLERWESVSNHYPGTITTTSHGQPYYPVSETNRTVMVNRYDPYWPVVPLVVGGLLWASYRYGHHGHYGYYSHARRGHHGHHGYSGHVGHHRPSGHRHWPGRWWR